MKKLEQALPAINNTAALQESLTKMLSDGQGTQGGKMIIQSAQPLIDHSKAINNVKEQAALLKSLMRVKKPKKCYADKMRREETENDVKYYRQFFWKIPECTEQEKALIQQNQLACPKDRIIDLITRYLEVHKKHIIEGEQKRLVLYTDMASMLYGLPEYALTLGILDIVNDAKQVWFPNVGQIRDAAEAHLLNWPKDLEAGEEPLR